MPQPWVRENVTRYQATGKLDVAYLATLSADAAPQLVGTLSLAGEHRSQLEAQLRDLKAGLDEAAARDGLERSSPPCRGSA